MTVARRRSLRGSPAAIAGELAIAEESARVLELQGRALLVPELVEHFEAIAEDAAERAAIMAEASAQAATGARGGWACLSSNKWPEQRADPQSASAVALNRTRETAKRRAQRIAELRRGIGFAARAHLAAQRPGQREYCAMVTLTYEGDAFDWRPRHISDYIKRLRKWCKANDVPVRYVWVAEMQKRGVLHYHVALFLPAGVVIPKPDQSGMWPHGSTRTEAARGAVGYLMKYMSKGTHGVPFPRGVRMYGAGGLEESYRVARRWLRYPAFVRSRSDGSEGWKRATGGGWTDPESGEVMPSEYVRVRREGAFTCERVRFHGRPFEAAGVFTWLHRRPAA